jgi:hypothetical protein
MTPKKDFKPWDTKNPNWTPPPKNKMKEIIQYCLYRNI